MAQGLGKEQKKNIMKDIILGLHKGLSPEEAKKRFMEEVGNVTSVEIAEIEQSLINEGLSPEEIKKFCNVHALIFESTLKQSLREVESPAHPVYLFKLENREIEKITAKLKEMLDQREKFEFHKIKQEIKAIIEKLKGIEVHYTRKEQLLFPFLEKHGFMGPSKVMWGKDNEIRELLKEALLQVDQLKDDTELENFIKNLLQPLIEEIEGMIFKEENILFPTSLEKLSTEEWVEVLKESDQIGYVFIEKPAETGSLIEELKKSVVEEPQIKDKNIVSFPSGDIELRDLMCLLNTLPVDITFIDKNDEVKYFNETKQRIFFRPRSVLGRKVQNCHPPQSVDVVEKILSSFKNGTKDHYDFWINLKDRLIFIRYFAVRDTQRNYLGTLEVTQDITEIKKLEGEKRLIDERD